MGLKALAIGGHPHQLAAQLVCWCCTVLHHHSVTIIIMITSITLITIARRSGSCCMYVVTPRCPHYNSVVVLFVVH